jgi:hypothetical protein
MQFFQEISSYFRLFRIHEYAKKYKVNRSYSFMFGLSNIVQSVAFDQVKTHVYQYIKNGHIRGPTYLAKAKIEYTSYGNATDTNTFYYLQVIDIIDETVHYNVYVFLRSQNVTDIYLREIFDGQTYATINYDHISIISTHLTYTSRI